MQNEERDKNIISINVTDTTITIEYDDGSTLVTENGKTTVYETKPEEVTVVGVNNIFRNINVFPEGFIAIVTLSDSTQARIYVTDVEHFLNTYMDYTYHKEGECPKQYNQEDWLQEMSKLLLKPMSAADFNITYRPSISSSQLLQEFGPKERMIFPPGNQTGKGKK